MKASVTYRCSKVINRLLENKSGLQTKTEGNTSTIRGQLKWTITHANIHRNEIFDNKWHIPDLVQDILRRQWWLRTAFMARQTSCFYGNFKIYRARKWQHHVAEIQHDYTHELTTQWSISTYLMKAMSATFFPWEKSN